MKKYGLVCINLMIVLTAFAQDIVPVKRKMLGIYNTSTFSMMPLLRNSNYYGYDLYMPVSQESRMAYSFRNTTGYRFFDALNVGLGTGADNFESSALIIPVYAEISGNILNKRFTPVYFVQAGYGAAIKISGKNQTYSPKRVEGGVSTLAGIGFGGRLDKNTLLRLNFGYRLQRASYVYEYSYNELPVTIQTRKMTYHRIEIGLSFTFQQ